MSASIRLRERTRTTLPFVLAILLAAGCAAPGSVVPESSGSGPTTPDAASVTPTASVSDSTPTASADLTDPSALIECRQVPEDVCFEYALAMIRGPHPDYAAGIGIERVLVTCERLPPCGADRRDSGGKIIVLYANGWAWTQDWAVLSGA